MAEVIAINAGLDIKSTPSISRPLLVLDSIIISLNAWRSIALIEDVVRVRITLSIKRTYKDFIPHLPGLNMATIETRFKTRITADNK